MSDDLDLDQLRKLCEAATDGPWRVEIEAGDEWYFGGNQAVIRHPDDEFDSVAVMGCDEDSPDFRFIAAARSALPALISEVERLRDEVDANGSWRRNYDAMRRSHIQLQTRLAALLDTERGTE